MKKEFGDGSCAVSAASLIFYRHTVYSLLLQNSQQNFLKSHRYHHNNYFLKNSMNLLYQRKPQTFKDQAETKDILILKLKNQLHQLRQLQKQYINLNAQVQNLEGKYELLLQQRERDERDQQLKTAMDSSTIEELRLELETLNRKADLVNSETEEGMKTNNALNKMVDVKSKEIEQLRKENALLLSRNQKKKAEMQGRFAQSKSVKEDKNRLEDMVLETRQQLDQSALKGKQLEREIKNRQNQNARLEKRVYATARAEEIVKDNLKIKNQQLRKQTARLASLEQVFDEMVHQLKQLEQFGDKKKTECDTAKTNYEQQLKKSKDLNTKLTKTENQLRGKQREINEMIKRRNQQVVNHQKQTEYNRVINMHLDKHLDIIYDYQGVNKDLISEIRAYCQVDERAREILNRTGRMQDVIVKVEKKIKASSSSLNHILRT